MWVIKYTEEGCYNERQYNTEEEVYAKRDQLEQDAKEDYLDLNILEIYEE